MKCDAVRGQAEAKIAEIREKIRTLKRMEQALAGLVADCRKRSPTKGCPILEEMKGVINMRNIFAITLLVLCLAAPAAFAGAGDGKTFLIHAKTSLKLDDAQICAVPNVAWTAHSKGYKVIILFDASGVTALKKGGIFGGSKTPLDKADLPERERKSLATQLHLQLEEVPKDYGEYIRYLKEKKGVALYANRTMMLLYKIGDDEIEPAVTPVGLERMINILEQADVYVAY